MTGVQTCALPICFSAAENQYSLGLSDEDFCCLCDVGLKDLINEFNKVIKEAKSSKRKMVVILDSVDQLRNNEQAFNLSWFVKL